METQKIRLTDWEFSEEVVLAKNATEPNLKQYHYETTISIADIPKKKRLIFIDIFNTLPPFKLYVNGHCLEETGKEGDQFITNISDIINESDETLHVKISLIPTLLKYDKELVGHVWLRIVSEKYIEKVELTPRFKESDSALDIRLVTNVAILGEVIVELTHNDELIKTVRRRISNRESTVNIRHLEVEPWRCSNPILYNVKIIVLEMDKTLFWEQQVGFSNTVTKKSGKQFFIDEKAVDFDRLYHLNNYPYWGKSGTQEQGYAVADKCYFMRENYPVVKLNGHSLENYFLDRCDQLGLPVIVELLPLAFTQTSVIQILRELKAIVKQYKHHPSIVAWVLLEQVDIKSELNLLKIIKESDAARPIILLKTSGAISDSNE